jgi:hypothetical protein
MGITMSLGVCERDCLCNGDGDVVCILVAFGVKYGTFVVVLTQILLCSWALPSQGQGLSHWIQLLEVLPY